MFGVETSQSVDGTKPLEAVGVGEEGSPTQHAHDVLQYRGGVVVPDDGDQQTQVHGIVSPEKFLGDRREYVQRVQGEVGRQPFFWRILLVRDVEALEAS